MESPSQINLNLANAIGGQQAFAGAYAPSPPQPYPLQGTNQPVMVRDSAPEDTSEGRKKGGYGGLLAICFFVMVAAAAGSFALLKYRGKLGLTFLEPLVGNAAGPASAAPSASPPASAAPSSAPATAPSPEPSAAASTEAAPVPASSGSASAAASSQPKK